ncbi:membrane protease YdiL (CAAX protease family) [Kribbella antiqua]|uniref:Membrane protease YdiL (CAAX protease family) n=1 Tax=Kribbella antiqua TaxID=2512217 RepID=A0A4R2IZ35_9ACTN|nr:type II CAAX endopeptidase family protein [Kribbella antiqua]TCO51231.1 membrane protease YdiL (CAAX protease family) [Kribbella antiqua]
MDPQQGEPRPQDSPPHGNQPGSQPPPGHQPPPWVPPYPQQPGQYPPPPQAPAPAQYPPPAQAAPTQYPPGQYPPGQYPPGQYPPAQQPPGGYYPPGQSPYWSPQQPPPWSGPPGQFAVREPRIIPAPSSTPYHRLARTPKHAWWRPLIGTLFLAALAFFVTAAVIVAWGVVHSLITGEIPEPQGNDIFPSALENLAATLVMLAVLTPAVALTVWLVQRRPAWSVASVLNRIRWRWLLLCCLPGLGYLVLSYGLGIVVDQIFPTGDPISSDEGSWVGFGEFVVPALIIICLVPFQAAAEEFVFRGWLIQAIGAYGPDQQDGRARWLRTALRTPWPGIVISGALFVSAHGYTGWAMLDIFLFAVTVGWLTVRTGGLEAGIALHALNNLLAFLLPAATGQLDGWADQGGAPWTLVLVDVPCLAFFAATVVWLSKRNRIAHVS